MEGVDSLTEAMLLKCNKGGREVSKNILLSLFFGSSDYSRDHLDGRKCSKFKKQLFLNQAGPSGCYGKQI